jgi:hypothetical protein
MKTNWFFSRKYSGNFLKKFRTSFPEKIPVNSLKIAASRTFSPGAKKSESSVHFLAENLGVF